VATKKKTTVKKPTIEAKKVAAPETPRLAPPPGPVESRSGHIHDYRPVGSLGKGAIMQVCSICADTKLV
jgi:hypothetical protein